MKNADLKWVKNEVISIKAYMKSYDMTEHSVIAETLDGRLAIHNDLYFNKEKSLTHIGSGLMIISTASIDPMESLDSFKLYFNQKLKRLKLLGEAIQKAIPDLSKTEHPNESDLEIIKGLITKARSGEDDERSD